MKKNLTVIFFILAIFGCKQKFYRAGSSSMEKTLMTGQRFLMTETKQFNWNDLVVFNIYSDDYSKPLETAPGWEQHWEKRVFRLIAISGDTLLIKNGEVYVNGKHVPLPATAMMSYEITSKDAIPEFDNAEQWNVSVSTTDSFIKYNAPLTKEEAEYYSHVKGIKEVKKILLNSSTDTFGLAKSSNGSEWTIDNYGPLIIPGTGETITVDEFNFNLYKNIPEIKMGKQLLRENLFFVLGDNRHRAQDSRYNGFISLSNMYGVVNK